MSVELRLVPLGSTRGLSDAESSVLRRVLDLGGVSRTIRGELLSAEVVAACSCGCPSVGLDAPSADAEYRDGPLSISTELEDGSVEVHLHLGYGTPTELEVWGGEPGTPGTLPDPRALGLG